MKAVGVVPYVYEPYFEEFKKTCKLHNVFALNNIYNNKGVAESWNQGIDYMKKCDADWLVIISAAMRFGEAGGLDIIEQIEKHPHADIIRFAKKEMLEQPFSSSYKAKNPPYPEVFYWHCTAISKEVIERVGYFDPNFYPIYFEDTDYDLRIRKAGLNTADIIVPIDAESVSSGHAVTLGDVNSPSIPLIAYFATKWGRHPSAPQLGEYNRPFNDPNNSLAFFPPAQGRIWNE